MADRHHTIRTSRLDLVLLPAVAMDALLAGDADGAGAIIGMSVPADLGERAANVLTLRLRDVRGDPAVSRWLLRAIGLREGQRRLVGLAGFHGPPDVSWTVELGYEVEVADRRNGYAAEAAAALTTWALTDGGARRVVAAIRPDNEASLGVMRRLGFAAAGSRWDAVNGSARLFERRTPPPVAAASISGSPPDGERAKMPHRSGAERTTPSGPEAPNEHR